MAAAVTGQKAVDRALADADQRVNELLGQLDWAGLTADAGSPASPQ